MSTILRCSFCAKSQDDVRLLIAGVNGYICDDCTLTCVNVVFDKAAKNLLVMHPKA